MGPVTRSYVFTDLVASTAQMTRLGPVAAEQLRSAHFGLLRSAAEATGGRIVKSLGDGLMVVYASVHGALEGAVTMQRNIARHNRRAREPLAVRVGVATGDAVEADGDFYGEAVVEAARLCANADGGQIVASDVVARLARGAEHGFRPLGPIELRGFPEPVEAFEVTWTPYRRVSPTPLPRRLATAVSSGFVDRTAERSHLAGVRERIASGDGHRLVLLSGEPGIGKTTLAAELGRLAHAEGAIVLYGRCDADVAVPYLPFVEAVGDLVDVADPSMLRVVEDRWLRELSRLVPTVRERLPDLGAPVLSDADADRFLLFGAVSAFFTGLSATAPVLLVLDDLHWAEKPTLLLLRHLVATLDRAEVLVVGAYRESELTDDHPLSEGLAMLRRQPSVDRLSIDGLDDESVVALLERLAGHELDTDGVALARAVRDETNGNPFFATEVLRHLAETGAVRQDEGRWGTTAQLSAVGLPESVREVIGHRVRRLGDAALRMLSAASVVGREFDLGLVARVADLAEDEALDIVESAMRASIVTEAAARSDRFSFNHALFQRTLHDELTASRRARLHERVALLLEADLGDDPGDRIGELANHWTAAATPDGLRKAATYGRRAGERALAALAPDEATRWFRRAIDLVDTAPDTTPGERLDLLIALGDAQRQAGDPGYRETLLAAAEEAAGARDTDRLVAAALANQRGAGPSTIGAVDQERVAMLEAALEAVGPAERAARAMLLAALAAELTAARDVERVRALAAEAEAIARRLGDESVLLRVLNLTFVPLWLPDGIERSLAATAEALELARRAGNPVVHFWAAIHRVYATTSAGDVDGVASALELAASLAAEVRQPFLTRQVLQVRCPHVLLAGDAEEAERLAGEALQIGTETAQPDALAVFGANLAGIRWHQGRLDEMLPLVAAAVADNPGLPGYQALHAVLLCECGQAEEAAQRLAEAASVDFHAGAYDYMWLTMTTLWAEVAVAVRDVDAAHVLYERLAPFGPQAITTGGSVTGTVESYLAGLAAVRGQVDVALRHFEAADGQLRALRAPFWRARNQVAWAEQLMGVGTDAALARARDLLAEARATAAAFGCAGIEARTTAVSGRAAGGVPAREG